MKRCATCKLEKDLSEFYKDKSRVDGLYVNCKSCKNQINRKSEERNRYHKEYYEKRKLTWRKANLKKKYNLTLEQYSEMLQKQDNKCAICGIDRKDCKKDHAVDHCHTTGKIRGLLCENCNRALGKFKDSTDLLHKAIEYLEKYK